MSGIGNVMRVLAGDAEYIDFGQKPSKKHYDTIVAFLLPEEPILEFTKNILEPICDDLQVITVCETETVHEKYGLIFDSFKNIFTPSEYCKKIFDRQFGINCKIMRHIVRVPKTFVFYTIGNITDPRKNIKMLLEAFLRLNDPSIRLLIKATCRNPINIKLKNVRVVQELLDDDGMESIHRSGDCYINCSHSEGVGMGAVEAAERGKPVIFPEYGGLKEYVPHDFMIPCTVKECGITDYLFQPHMKWGFFETEQLMDMMRKVKNMYFK